MNEITEIKKEDITQIINVHNKSFKDFFLTNLGNNFLTLYYSSLNNHKDVILLGFFSDEKLYGFCAATILSKGFNAKLIKDNYFSYALIGTKLLLTRPFALVRLIKNFKKKNSNIQDDGNYAELLSIGVNPQIQGAGIGRKLLKELEHRLKEKGIKRLSLTTDYFNNDKAISFYKLSGYEVMYDFISYPNRKMYRLIKNL